MSGITITCAIANEVAIAAISSSEAPIEPRICGSATLTMERSIVAMIAPKLIDTATSHLLSGARASTGVARGNATVDMSGSPRGPRGSMSRAGPCVRFGMPASRAVFGGRFLSVAAAA